MFEQYLKAEMAKGAIDFAMRAQIGENGDVTFYIHPADRGGETGDFTVNGSVVLHTPPYQHLSSTDKAA